MDFPVEHLLAPPLYLAPQSVGDRMLFVSNLSGRMSLWAMDTMPGMPEPLLPTDVSLFNPKLVNGETFVALPELGVIVVSIDQAGDENLQPCVVPLSGGAPEPLFGERFRGQQVTLVELAHDGRGTISVDTRAMPERETYEIDVAERRLTFLGKSRYGNRPVAHTSDRGRYLLRDTYTAGDSTLWLLDKSDGQRRLLSGKPWDMREPGEQVQHTGFGAGWFVDGGRAALVVSTAFEDRGSVVRVPCEPDETAAALPDGGSLPSEDSRPAEGPARIDPVTFTGVAPPQTATLETIRQLGKSDGLLVTYNADGVSYGYRGVVDAAGHTIRLDETVWGAGELAEGVVGQFTYDEAADRIALSFSSARKPAQLVTVDRDGTTVLTSNRVLGIDRESLAAGEDASFESHDGLRVSARLYLPSERLGFTGPRPLIYYIHGGPQSQERPDYTWFSMPLIQYFTLHGYAVFVPNVRGSSGYGMDYLGRVDRDWGGQDRLDHVAGVRHLADDPRVNTDRIGLVGRSYGGYMTQTLAGRHPELWRAAVNMFGPYDLLAWLRRLPEAWRASFRLSIGDPDTEAEEIVARSPSTYLDQLACPMLVIQGANDPRVVKSESDDLVARLRAQTKDVEYLVFPDEGHDFTKLANQIHCYRAIADFFARHV